MKYDYLKNNFILKLKKNEICFYTFNKRKF